MDPFQVLHLCSEFGLPLLQSCTLHYVSSTLTSESVSRTLLTSESLLESYDDDVMKVALQRVQLDCISYIQTHTRTVFLTESFLLLPKETLIKIVSDNKVCKVNFSVFHFICASQFSRLGWYQVLLPFALDFLGCKCLSRHWMGHS